MKKYIYDDKIIHKIHNDLIDEIQKILQYMKNVYIETMESTEENSPIHIHNMEQVCWLWGNLQPHRSLIEHFWDTEVNKHMYEHYDELIRTHPNYDKMNILKLYIDKK